MTARVAHRGIALIGAGRASPSRTWGRVALAIVLAWCISSPMYLLLSHPNRISVYSSLQVDAQTYDEIATRIASGAGLRAMSPLQPPGFIGLLAVVYYAFGHSWMVAKLVLWGFFVATVCLSGLLAWRIYENEDAVWGALLLTASSRALQSYVGTLQYEVVAGFLLVWWLLCANRAAGSESKRPTLSVVLFGVLTAVCVLTREVFVVLILFAPLYIWWRARLSRGDRNAAKVAVAVLASAAVPVVAWAAFQSEQAGRPVVITDKASSTLAMGNNPKADGTFNNRLVGDPVDPSGLKFIRERPGRFLSLAVRKLLYFWGILPDAWNVSRPSSVWIARLSAG